MSVPTNTTKYLIPVGDTEPDVNSLPVGSLWFNNKLGQLYILYRDADSLQWVQFSTSETPVI
jgi:hypothetical protein